MHRTRVTEEQILGKDDPSDVDFLSRRMTARPWTQLKLWRLRLRKVQLMSVPASSPTQALIDLNGTDEI
jgi:hypothetical protein